MTTRCEIEIRFQFITLSGVHTACPENQYCWAATTCNVHEFWPDPTERPTRSPVMENPPSASPSDAPSVERTGEPTSSPLAEDDPANFMYCGIDWLDASTRCRIKCPTQKCPDGLMCFTGTGCPALPYDSPAPIESSPTHTPSLLQINASPPPSFATAEINDKVNSNNPTNSNDQLNPDLPSKIPSASNTQPDVTNSFISRESESPTITPEDNYSEDDFDERSDSPTVAASLQPTESQSTVIIPSIPTEHTKPLDINLVSLPDVSLENMPKPSLINIQTTQRILQNIKPTLDSEIFVVETRGGSVIPSNVYTYDGFLSSLEYFARTGITEDYFYLGDEKTIHQGLVNLALFMAKVVTDAVVYESCNSNKLACGIWALDSTFDGKTQFQCSNNSQHSGLECQQGIGCACVLGILDHNVGSKSQSRSTPYSEVHFCSTDAFESICSRYLRNGEELRWLTPMMYWVSFVQRYQSNDSEFAETYKSGLDNFVRNGMRDTAFIEFVSDISVSHEVERAPREKFVATYFKIIDLFLSELTLLIPEQLTRTPSESPITDHLVPQVIIPESVPPTNAPTTLMPVIIDNQSLSKTCPKLCVIPIKTSECPLHHQRLKHCFSDFIGIDEVCMAAYGECDTSTVSINDCAQSYNVFKRIDCSALVNYPQSEREESLSSITPVLNLPSSQPVPSVLYDETSETPSISPSNTPTTKPTSFGGIVWWDSINTSSGRGICPGIFYNTHVFILSLSIMIFFN